MLSQGGALMLRLVLYKRKERQSSVSKHQGKPFRRKAIPRKRVPTKARPCWHSDLNLPGSRQQEISFCCWTTQSMVVWDSRRNSPRCSYFFFFPYSVQDFQYILDSGVDNGTLVLFLILGECIWSVSIKKNVCFRVFWLLLILIRGIFSI